MACLPKCHFQVESQPGFAIQFIQNIKSYINYAWLFIKP
jgi:hypothetical protein